MGPLTTTIIVYLTMLARNYFGMFISMEHNSNWKINKMLHQNEKEKPNLW